MNKFNGLGLADIVKLLGIEKKCRTCCQYDSERDWCDCWRYFNGSAEKSCREYSLRRECEVALEVFKDFIRSHLICPNVNKKE